jgi:hypothetical protein
MKMEAICAAETSAFRKPHGDFISQKTAFFIVTAAKTPNLTHTG